MTTFSPVVSGNQESDLSIEDSFAKLFEQSLQKQDARPGAVIMAEVVRIERHFIIVNAGLKSESLIPREEFENDDGSIDINPGDFVSVALEAMENGYGDTILSRDKAKRLASWLALEKALESGEPVHGLVTGKVKGGFSVQVNGVRAFLPGSQVDTRGPDAARVEGQSLDFKVIKLDRKRDNVVLSRRALMEASLGQARQKLAETLNEGDVVTGVVKNITDYGAFVDLGGLDGLLHITDIAWRRVRHPSEALTPGQTLQVKILKFDKEKNRISLGLKQLGSDPWEGLERRHPKGSRLFGKVTSIADYGAFVEMEEGIEGMVHASEMTWATKSPTPSKMVTLGEQVEVMVLEIDEGRRRISLGMKQCQANPWTDFSEQHQKGDKVTGTIKSVTDFGIFVGLEGGVDGLVHLTDLSWTESGEEVVKRLKKGDAVETVVLAIDASRERVSLGIKQLTEDPHPKEGKADSASNLLGKEAVKEAKSKPSKEAKVSKPAKEAAEEKTAFGNLLHSAVNNSKDE